MSRRGRAPWASARRVAPALLLGPFLGLAAAGLAGCEDAPAGDAAPVTPGSALFAVHLQSEVDDSSRYTGQLVLVDADGSASAVPTRDGHGSAPRWTPAGPTLALPDHDAVLRDTTLVEGPARTRMESEVFSTVADGRTVRVMGAAERPSAGLSGPMVLGVWDGDPAHPTREVRLPEWIETGGACGSLVHLVTQPARGPRHLLSVDVAGDGPLRVRDVGPLRGDVLGVTGIRGTGCLDGDPVVVTNRAPRPDRTSHTFVTRIDARTAALTPLRASEDLVEGEETWTLVGQVGTTAVLAAGHDRDVVAVDLGTGTVRTLLADPGGERHQVAVAGDRALVLSHDGDGTAFSAVVLEVTGGRVVQRLDVELPAPGRDGEYVEVAGLALRP